MPEWRSDIEKEFGKEVFISGFSGEAISSGSFVVDSLTGIGGFPLGHISEVFGDAGYGKTTLALMTIKEALLAKKPVLYLDYETTVSDRYLNKLGIDPVNLENYRITPSSMEEGWMLMKRFCEFKNHYGGLIVVDSLAAMPPTFDMEKMADIVGSSKVGSMAQVMSIAFRQMTVLLRRSCVGLIFINQERANIDFRGSSVGKVTPGGNALKFYASIRLQMQSKGTVMRSDSSSVEEVKTVKSIKIGARLIKNKFGPSYKYGTLFIRMDEGIDNLESAIAIALKVGFINQSKAQFSLDSSYTAKDSLGKKNITGFERVRDYFLKHEDAYAKLIADVKTVLNKEEASDESD